MGGTDPPRKACLTIDPTAAAAMAMRESASIRGRVRPSKRARVTRGGDDASALASSANPDDGSLDAFERQALGPLLWRRPEASELVDIPAQFRDARHYVRAFEPVLMEETREEVRSAWVESLGERRQFPLRLQSLEVAGGGWRRATLVCDDTRDAETLRSLCPEQSVAVLCERRVDETDPWPRSVDGEELPVAVAGFVERVMPREGFVQFKFYVSDAAHVRTDPSSAGWKPWHETLRRREREALEAFEGVRRPIRGADGRESAVDTAPGTEEGETTAALPRAEGRRWWLAPAGKLSSASQAYEALHNIKRLHTPMRAAMLAPPLEGMPRTIGREPPPLAEEVAAHPAFVRFLDANFNEPQLAAIRWSAAHTLRSYERDRAAAANEATADEASAPSSAPSSAPFPFTLVQGPPGTGKTHTVWGILNILHLVLYQRHYQHLHRAIALGTARASGGDASFTSSSAAAGWIAGFDREDEPDADVESATVNDLFDTLKRAAGVERGHNYGVSKPRILVCAPSNAATDNLLERVMSRGFRKTDGDAYYPDVIRVGAADAMVSEKVTVVHAQAKVEGLMRMSPREWDAHYRKQAAFAKEAAACISYHERKHVDAARERASADDAGRNGAIEPDELVRTAERLEREDDARVREMLRLNDDRNKAVADMARLAYLLTHLGGGGGGGGDDGGKSRGSRERRKGKTHRVRAALEASFVDDAEIVFTTLASSSRRVFRQLTHGFDTVLVDEAAQANEVATLIPFLHGARRCVLVGDPQQLPSTVLSGAAQGVSFQRSLFERFVALGAEATLLSVQYRMHPEIRAFPSSAFYDGRLVDSDSVVTAAARREPYHDADHLGPYVVFDASGGAQHKSATGGLSNAVEALAVVCLYKKLELAVRGAAESVADVTVAVITPYREQRALILRAFAVLCGGEGAAARLGVSVSTVDGYQGQEADVVIVSTVRGGERAAGVGFLADVRRMNVALTRAKRALWVVGRMDALRRSPMWARLAEDAAKRGLVVADADSRELFADAVPVARQEAAMEELARGRRGWRGDGGGAGRGGGGGSGSGGWSGGGDRGRVPSSMPDRNTVEVPPPPPKPAPAREGKVEGNGHRAGFECAFAEEI